MNKKVGAQVDDWTPTPTWQIQSPEHLVKKKFWEFYTSYLAWPKKVSSDPPPKTSESRDFCKRKNSQKNFWPQIWHDQKEVGARTLNPPKKIQSPEPDPVSDHAWNIQRTKHSVNKKFQKMFTFKFGMTQKSWCLGPQPPRKIQSPEHSVRQKKVSCQIWYDHKKLVQGPNPSPTNSESRVLSKGKNCEKYFVLKFGMTKTKFVLRPIPLKNSKSRVLCKQKNSEKFLTSNLAWPKNVDDQTHPQPKNNSESRVLSKGKNSENVLTSNLAWPKNVDDQTHPQPKNIQSPECSVKEKILKNFWPQIWHDQKMLMIRHTPTQKKFRV